MGCGEGATRLSSGCCSRGGAELNVRDNCSPIVLSDAAFGHDGIIMALFLKPDARESGNQTTLVVEVKWFKEPIVKLLVENSTDIEAKGAT
jgi:hypothetical protein